MSGNVIHEATVEDKKMGLTKKVTIETRYDLIEKSITVQPYTPKGVQAGEPIELHGQNNALREFNVPLATDSIDVSCGDLVDKGVRLKQQ